MQISVRLFGSMKQYAPDGEASFTMTFATGFMVGDVLLSLKITPSIEKTVLLNGRRVDETHPIEDGGLMAIFPHIEGG